MRVIIWPALVNAFTGPVRPMADAEPPRNSLICPVACVRFDKPCCAIAAAVLPSPKMVLITALVSFAFCVALANPSASF